MYRRCKKKENTEKGNALSRKPQRKDFSHKCPENSKPFFKINNK